MTSHPLFPFHCAVGAQSCSLMPLAHTLLLLAVLACGAAASERLARRPDARRLLAPPATKPKDAKLDVCHYDAESNSYRLISVAETAWVRQRCWHACRAVRTCTRAVEGCPAVSAGSDRGESQQHSASPVCTSC